MMAHRKVYVAPPRARRLVRRFMCRLDDGWNVVQRTPDDAHYICTPVDGWRVWWWHFRITVEGTWWGFGTIRLHPRKDGQ